MAELVQAKREYDRNRQLFDARIITQSEFDAIEYRHTIAKAGVTSAQVTVDRARQNLAYTSIYAPIDGIVVERNVDVGQTVAASLSAPQLFLIANDLSRMQILASVDESDIGLIEEGQAARFTVQAYPTEAFTGMVRQVRLQSATMENVVSYTVVVEVENPTGKLLPGMTATVSFITGAAEDALVVPNAALRFRPSGSGAPSPAGGLWYVGEDGELAVARVRTGISDGTRTVVSGDSIEAGMQVIVGEAVGGTSAPAPASPFQSQQSGGPRRPGGF
jgi:HlyD family secretion protein